VEVRVTHVGGPTVLLEFGGWRLLTDPTFDPAGGKYRFGWGTGSEKLAAPAIGPEEIGPLDAVLLSHDHHEDNLDAAGRALLPSAKTVVTTVPGAKRLGADPKVARAGANGGPELRGLAAWEKTTFEAPGKPAIEIVATPCRHGPPGTHPIVGEVVGFCLTWEGQEHGSLWISGDTVLYGGVRQVPERLQVGTALLHLGGVRFPVSGPLRYTMTGAEAVELCGALRPQTAIPIHYEGWKHFREHREAVEQALTDAPAEVSAAFRWLPIGTPTELDV
jgi:L-ascorbate metabolism protein UlaG (beta-lactamase superfamily)